MEKLFNVGGVSKNKGGYKVRFATDIAWRVKSLSKIDTEVTLMELPRPMTKPEIVTFLKTTDIYSNPNFRECIDAADVKYNGTVTTKATKVKVSMESLKARAEEVTE